MIFHRNSRIVRSIAVMLLMAGAMPASQAANSLMSTDWARLVCTAWNEESSMRAELFRSGWVTHDKGRGYKIIQLYRSDCGQSPPVQLRISAAENEAICTYGGAVDQTPDKEVDYVMFADTARWQEMGRGEYGPMSGMLFGRLKFEGPKWEAMKNMGPFGTFLLLVGKVPSDVDGCP